VELDAVILNDYCIRQDLVQGIPLSNDPDIYSLTVGAVRKRVAICNPREWVSPSEVKWAILWRLLLCQAHLAFDQSRRASKQAIQAKDILLRSGINEVDRRNAFWEWLCLSVQHFFDETEARLCTSVGDMNPTSEVDSDPEYWSSNKALEEEVHEGEVDGIEIAAKQTDAATSHISLAGTQRGAGINVDVFDTAGERVGDQADM